MLTQYRIFTGSRSRLRTLSRGDDEIAAYDNLIGRFASATELPLREQVAKALFNKGVALGTLGRGEDAIVVYDDLVARFAAATELPLREQVARAKNAKDHFRKS